MAPTPPKPPPTMPPPPLRTSKAKTFGELGLKYKQSFSQLRQVSNQSVASSIASSTASGDSLILAKSKIDEAIKIAIEYHYAYRGKLDNKLEADVIRGKVYRARVKKANAAICTFKRQSRRLRTWRHRMAGLKDSSDPKHLAAELIYRSFYKDSTTQKKKNSSEQSQFRRLLLDTYDARSDNGDGQTAWCVVNGAWVPQVKAAHIVPSSFSAAAIEYICGSGCGVRIYKPENGLPLQDEIERNFDNGNLVIVPVNPNDSQSDWQVRILNPASVNTLTWMHHRGTYAQRPLRVLDHRVLSFRNIERPMRRFMYFRYLLSMMHHKISHPGGVQSAYKELCGIERSPWPSMGKYLRHSFLLEYAVAAGDSNPWQIRELMEKLDDDPQVKCTPIEDPEEENSLSQDVVGIMEESSFDLVVKADHQSQQDDDDDLDDYDIDWATADDNLVYTEEEIQAQKDQKNPNFLDDLHKEVIENELYFRQELEG